MKISEFKKLKKGTDIYFKGQRFTIPWDISLKVGGNNTDIPLSTTAQYENLRTSYAHIYWNDTESKILRFKKKIGSIEDISLTKEG